ncbi:threonine aldolase family protein [Zavarzinia sp. CC-PAN008]|uniref:threonine aldolase family protein n=1 Tax=Zavarzinia sp. CC-PAN008 TaxID=3243332 RepID=UPI003F7458AB
MSGGEAMNFGSDNVTGVHPRIMEAMARANHGTQPSYGADEVTTRLQQRLADLFEHEVVAFPVATGTAANALALAQVTPQWGSVLAHAEAHVCEDECGAPEAFNPGSRVIGIPGAHGKLEAAGVARILDRFTPGFEHQLQPSCLSLTQATEAGTVYSVAEVTELANLAHERGLAVHMDGARFANAVAHLKCSAADLTWRAGIDVVSFGATKNGAMAAEAVIFFDPARAEHFRYRRKRVGHLFSKMRFVSAQLEAYVADDLWLANAAHANAMALKLADGLIQPPGTRLAHPVQANEVFVRLPTDVAHRLEAGGVQFHDWPGEPATDGALLYRFVTAFDTDPAAVDRVVALAAGTIAAAG